MAVCVNGGLAGAGSVLSMRILERIAQASLHTMAQTPIASLSKLTLALVGRTRSDGPLGFREQLALTS